ncbi:MAG: tripartite tricarboxylate transporter substrate binding protein [Sulfuritalea sp.]|jgi:tripartite-type tricarboxylate transporter receptor subunit TctC|uniref:Bug family tripartite tricarboxylate transporter substrate binding protein n=1 Tax=Aquabacterium sp. TaxID=1872578 RepID=UPI001B58C649|nr:tripartite tricarboxylate transporter substrate binding protein [Aquabacterium sp.]MBK7022352.1 tripartite tricarboxylate transporter substrate binding protein [Sulfuritalea sp.]MBP7133282.1 tripartite tricarboxylate transporter substrate binding protein [Aquabacterium sp.]
MIRPMLVAAAIVAALLATSAQAQAYPAKPIRMITPFPPGGGTDYLARTVANKLTEFSKWTVVVDNRAGAGGTIGIAEAAKASALGYDVVMGQLDNLAVAPLLYKNLPYDVQRDLQPVALVADSPIILLTASSSPYQSLADVVAAAKAVPDSITFATAGSGTVSHLVAELFGLTAGIKMRHIPYKGSTPALIDVMGGQVGLLSSSIPSALAQVKSGKLRPLAVSSARRSPSLPDVPTIAESGYKDFNVGVWYGVFAPAGTPKPIVTALNAEINKVLMQPDVQQSIRSQGGDVNPTTPEELGLRLKADILKWRGVIDAAKITLE